jgi:outer membrane protein OmpA-like peptidoglycan-associated protein
MKYLYHFNINPLDHYANLEQAIERILDERANRKKELRKKAINKVISSGVLFGFSLTALPTRAEESYNTIESIQANAVANPSSAQIITHKAAVTEVAYYPVGQYKLTPAHFDRLDQLVSQLPADAEVTVIGNTDKSGGKRYNLELGKKRAKYVAMYLAYKGVNVVSVKSRGFSKPLDNRSYRNRRVDILIESIINIPEIALEPIHRPAKGSLVTEPSAAEKFDVLKESVTAPVKHKRKTKKQKLEKKIEQLGKAIHKHRAAKGLTAEEKEQKRLEIMRQEAIDSGLIKEDSNGETTTVTPSLGPETSTGSQSSAEPSKANVPKGSAVEQPIKPVDPLEGMKKTDSTTNTPGMKVEHYEPLDEQEDKIIELGPNKDGVTFRYNTKTGERVVVKDDK